MTTPIVTTPPDGTVARRCTAIKVRKDWWLNAGTQGWVPIIWVDHRGGDVFFTVNAGTAADPDPVTVGPVDRDESVEHYRSWSDNDRMGGL